MIKRLLLIFTVIWASLYMVAAENLPDPIVKAVETYNKWNSVAINGKLHLDNLIINPSLKIYMENGVKIMISARVPFKGEVARIEIDTVGILAVNRLKKTYCRAEKGDVLKEMPLSIDDIQSLLLGRLWIAGSGQLTAASAPEMAYSPEDDCIVCVPKEQPFKGYAQYGFTIGYDSCLQAFYASATNSNLALLIEYVFKDKGKYECNVQWSDSHNANAGFGMTFDTPQWDAEPMEPWLYSPKYKQVELTEILKF